MVALAVVAPSPQEMAALYSPGAGWPPRSSEPAGSLKVATVTTPEAAPSVKARAPPGGPATTTDGSVTWAVEVTAAESGAPSWWTTVLTRKGPPPAGSSSV